MKIVTNQELVLKKREGDVSSVELVKRPRGRPPGSKNKPKPPIIINQEQVDPTPLMRAHILDIQSGQDIINALYKFSKRNGVGLSVLSVSGAVTNLILRQSPQDQSLVRFEGRFEMLSLAMTVMPTAVEEGVAVTVTVSGVQGRVMGGVVARPLVTAGTVTVVAAVFENTTVCRLPEDDDVAGSESGQEQEDRHCVDQEGGVDTCRVEMRGSLFSPEVGWAPAARPPPY